MKKSFKKDYYRNTHGKKYSFFKYFTMGKKLRLIFWYRKVQNSAKFMKKINRLIYRLYFGWNNNDIPYSCEIGEGLYLGHSGGRYLSSDCKIGSNCNINQNVTVGRENRKNRQGAPIIGNEVWIGANSVIVGNITIGDNVLIAPNSFVNFDVPSDSIVVGSPSRIIHDEKATDGYINDIIYE